MCSFIGMLSATNKNVLRVQEHRHKQAQHAFLCRSESGGTAFEKRKPGAQTERPRNGNTVWPVRRVRNERGQCRHSVRREGCCNHHEQQTHQQNRHGGCLRKLFRVFDMTDHGCTPCAWLSAMRTPGRMQAITAPENTTTSAATTKLLENFRVTI